MSNILRFIKTDPNAVTPSRAHSSDVGYDLTAISVYKIISNKTIIFETGIAVQPPYGKYIEILPRSSITKTGYIICNSVGVIDTNYIGSLKIAVTKIDETLPDLKVPFCKFQIVMRNLNLYDIQEVELFDDTDRGDGCFGSSG